MQTVQCAVSKQPIPLSQSHKGSDVRGPLLQFIQQEHPDFTADSYVSNEQLNAYRRRYIAQLVTQEAGEANRLEAEVINAVQHNRLLSENIEEGMAEKLTAGQRVADKIAAFGGSWTFILFFFSFLLLWMAVNVLFLAKAFDPYPFILLNLILSCLAAIQAPIIMMSQNRQGEKDRQRSEHDYKVNLKAEIEIRLLHEKIDHLMVHQSKHLLEIQQLQADYLEDILRQMRNVSRET